MESSSEKVYRAALRFLVPLSLEETFPLVVSEAIKLAPSEYGSIFLEQGGRLQRMYVFDPALYRIKTHQNDPVYDALKTHQPIFFNRKDIIKVHPELAKTNLSSSIVVPLLYRNKVTGVLALMSSKKNAFTIKEAHLLKLFSPLVSLTIRKAQLFDETKRALEARDLFISMAAHEIRTPLTTINGYIQLLYSKFAGADTRESRWVEELAREGERMIKLVQEFLQIERIKSGRLQYIWKECSLSAVVDRAKLNFRFTHPDHKIIFENKLKDQPDLVIGDFDKLVQVVINVLNNAIKFSTPATFITIRLQLKAPKYLILKVRDKGTGIPKKDLPHIFKRYYRGSNPQREGIGLGLFLAKNIIEEHRGKIEVHSQENKGTTVQIKLPMAQEVIL